MTTSNENAQNQAFPPHLGILQILNGAHVAGAVSCLAQLGIPDLLENGPKSAQELARQIGAQPEALYRLMRATACVGVLVLMTYKANQDGTCGGTKIPSKVIASSIWQKQGGKWVSPFHQETVTSGM
jgi:hypothetical protein